MKTKITIAGWLMYSIIAFIGAFFLFPHDPTGGLRLFAVLGVVLMIAGMDYFANRLLDY